jgi:site-specific recombinase XerD
VAINLYLTKFRTEIAGANKHQGLWPSAKGHPMSGGAIYDAVCRRTLEGLGFPVNLHRFRGAAGNLWSISDPMNVRGAKDLLGHTDFGTTGETLRGSPTAFGRTRACKGASVSTAKVTPDRTRV